MSELVLGAARTRRAYRLAVGALFFLQGLCFASWASRIPSIQQRLQLSDPSLGMILLALPAGSMIALPFSGWLVTRLGSRKVATSALLLYSLLLTTIGLADSVVALVFCLMFFGIAGNTSNIAINTQAVGVEAKYGRSIMASFHGLWSLAGFTAAGIGSFMIGRSVTPLQHFGMICGLILAAMAATYPFLLPDEIRKSTTRTPLFVMPDKPLMTLGIIAFCCMICEGAMFDWSGIYFQKVVEAEKAWIGAGYTAFMLTMAAGRFVADRVTVRIGFRRTIQLSGLLVATGLGISVLFPYLPSAIAGFLLVGFGVSSVVPLVYSEAGKSRTLAPGMALAAVSSIGFFGFLIGPPVIGMVAGLSGLRFSFVLIALAGLTVALTGSRIRKES